MATPEQIASILSQLVALHPADCFKPIDAANAGLGAVLRLLYLADQPVTAGTISEKLHVSTARVAVLLKKLVAKGLVTKGRDPVDAGSPWWPSPPWGHRPSRIWPTICTSRWACSSTRLARPGCWTSSAPPKRSRACSPHPS